MDITDLGSRVGVSRLQQNKRAAEAALECLDENVDQRE
jgi:hypothetical protein